MMWEHIEALVTLYDQGLISAEQRVEARNAIRKMQPDEAETYMKRLIKSTAPVAREKLRGAPHGN